MATRVRVECINKSNRSDPYDRIEGIGGRNADGTRWWLPQATAIAHIEAGNYAFHVERPTGDAVDVIVAVSRYGNKYLKTTADGDAPNNLLSLPECTR